MKLENEYRKDIIEVCKRLYQKGFVASNDGNVSVRVSEREIIATPTGINKGDLSPDQLIKVNMNGELISGFLKPSSELKLHIRAYEKRYDVKAVVHAHPPISTGFAVAGIALDQMAIPEVIATMGSVPLAPYGTPSTDELARSIDEFIDTCNAVLLSNHGVVTVGADVFSAYYTLERVEHSSYIIWVARSLGGERPLGTENIRKLMEVKRKTEELANFQLSQPEKMQSSRIPNEIEDKPQKELIDLITRVIVETIKSDK